MINLTEAIKHCKDKAKELKEEVERKDLKYGKSNNPIDLKVAADCLECAGEHEQLAGWLEELAERRETDRWIPVSERLPEDDGQYLVTREEYIPSSPEYRTFDTDGASHWEMVVDLARFEGNFNRAHNYENHNNGFNKAYKVYAWKPLPEPYESEDKNEKR